MSVQKELEKRAVNKCELCSSTNDLKAFAIEPQKDSSLADHVLTCSTCYEQLSGGKPWDNNHWHCLSETMWSEHLAVQVCAYRVLKTLNESWSNDLAEQLYFETEDMEWANTGLSTSDGADTVVHKDSNGTVLNAGDTVTLIKDLDVKGANFTAKRGTTVKNIRLTENPEHIEGRVNGTLIVLVTKFLKRLS